MGNGIDIVSNFCAGGNFMVGISTYCLEPVISDAFLTTPKVYACST